MLVYLVLERNTIIAVTKRKADADAMIAADTEGRRIVTIPADWGVVLNQVAFQVYADVLDRGR